MINKKFLRFIVSKIVLFVAILIFSATISVAQSGVVIAANKSNLLFIGVNNPVTITAPGIPEDQITVSLSGGQGSVSKTAPGLYDIRVSSETDSCVLRVYVRRKLAATAHFRTSTLPEPLVTIGGYRSGSNIPANFFRVQSGVGVFLQDFPFEMQYKLIGFQFGIDDGKGAVLTTGCQGNVFSPVAREYINRQVMADRTVTISDILAIDQDGRKYKLPSVVYYIK